MKSIKRRIGGSVAACSLLFASAAAAVSYDIVYVRQPRYGDTTAAIWPEVFHPARLEPGADLMLLHPNGTEEVLVAGGSGAVTDPYVSFDGQSVYYAFFPDVRASALNTQRDNLPYAGADIYRIHVPTRQITRLTFGEFTPNLGAGNWDTSNPVNPPPQFNRLGYGILNLGPCPLPGGKVAFVSNRNGFWPQKGFTAPTLQLYVMDEDGKNVTAIAPMTVSSALHPTILRDGRILWSSHEDQGLRDTRLWGLWAIWPDGRLWEPVVSAFHGGQAWHFQTQISNGDLVVENYYNLNNNGFGALFRLPSSPPPGQPAFHSAFPGDNPGLDQTVGGGFLYPFKMPFTPRGMYALTPFTHPQDEAAPLGANGQTRVGKFTHPSGAPNNDLLVVWTPGPANDLNRPTPLPRYDGGLYLIPGSQIVTSENQLVLLKNDPAYNEAWPRALVPYSAVYGVPEPAELPWLPNDGTVHAELPAGTPYGLVGTSSLYKRESFPGHITPWSNWFNGLDVFNTSENDHSSNWQWQGADAGRYTNSDLWAIRILAMEANTHRSYGPHEGRHFISHAGERLRILGEIPVRKTSGGQPVLDPEGNPDTSFLAKIPADTPFTFQLLDRRGMVLTMAQTWHQVRPGEMRANCGGCHAHSQQPLSFESTAAASPGYSVWDLVHETPLLTRDTAGNPGLAVAHVPAVNVEFYRDIRPILQRSCISCHTRNSANPPGNLVLDDTALVSGLPGDYKRLADDQNATWGHPPVIGNGTWRQTNASRYIRAFQSRRSLLMWKLWGTRTDGWTNADHPTETTPGNAATLPGGADPNSADLDFTGTIMPPPGSGAPPLSEDEKLTFARWIDLGCPINTGQQSGSGAYGWFLDDQRPTVAVSLPRPGLNSTSLTAFRFGLADAYTGIDLASLSVTADFAVNGRPAGAELADLATEVDDGIYQIPITGPLPPLTRRKLHVEINDVQGNRTAVDVHFSTVSQTLLFADGFESGGMGAWTLVQP